ncbi:MAG: DUF6285 domain-containing protein [Burkholderiaceae bacterium]|jgi:hypothetical protein|nr:DUF6285 domain-containing protein [Burkholderiaceae bacterium]
MQDHPSVTELLEAVTACLRTQVVPASEDRVAFLARVAANALDIVRREVQLAPAAQARELQRLQALLGADAPADLAAANRLLCERIAAGSIGAGHPGLVEHLRRTTRDKLAIDQPGYAGGDKQE